MAGEIAKGLKLWASGKEMDYEGANDVTYSDVGEAEDAFIEKGISGGKFSDVAQRLAFKFLTSAARLLRFL